MLQPVILVQLNLKSGFAGYLSFHVELFERTMKTNIYSITGWVIAICATLATDYQLSAANLAGKWEASASFNETESRDSVFTIRKKDGKLTASMINEDGEKRDMDRAKVDGETLVIEFDFERDGAKGIIGAKADLQKDGSLVGKWYVRSEDGTEQMTNDWKAVRSLSAHFAGKWEVVAETEENDIQHDLIIKKSGSSFTAVASSDAGDTTYSSVKVSKNEVNMQLPFGGGTVKVSAKLKQARKLVGEWKYYDDFNEEVAKGTWTAQKAKVAKSTP